MNTETAANLKRLGAGIIRYGLVVILLWIGFLKFTPYEAEGIKPLVMNSPFLSWGYKITSVEGFSKFIGIIEIILGILIASKRISAKVSAIGSIGVIIMSITTLSFLISTPAAAIWQMGYGFPYLSPMPGQFLIKDILMLGAAAYTAGESLLAAKRI